LRRWLRGQFHAPAHLARHPFGKVPVLEDGDFSLYETQAILRHLDRVIPEPVLTPAETRAASRMDQLMNINDWYLYQGVSNIICFQRVVGPALMGLTPDLAVINEAMPRAHAVFGESRSGGRLGAIFCAPVLTYWRTLRSGAQKSRLYDSPERL
jgi:glutathione S-transferase